MKELRRILVFLNAYRAELVISAILAIVTVGFQLYIPVLFGRAIDGIAVYGSDTSGRFTGILLQLLVFILLTSVLTWVMNVVNNRLVYHSIQDMRTSAIRALQQLPLRYFDSHRTGDLVQRMIADADQIADGLLLGFSQVFSGVVTIVLTLVFMFRMDAQIMWTVLLLTPVSFLVSRLIAKHSFQAFHRQMEVRGKQTALINEMIGSQKIVQAFSYQQTASKRFSSLNDELKTWSTRALFFSSLTNPSTRAVNNVIYAFAALLGAQSVMKGSLSVGMLAVLLTYANQFMKPFNDIAAIISELQGSLACVGRLFDLVDAEKEEKDAAGSLMVTHGEVQIKNIHFSYEPHKPLIEDFSFFAQAGSTIAIVGPTGCGKTTLINLLLRFYEVNAGYIFIDGQNIRCCSRHSLRAAFGMVLQDTWLKEGTVRENIAFGKAEATEEEIIAAAKAAHCWEFIARFPHGLDEVIREDMLSQGQKQLLCISRVFLKKPKILILDEATSNIDTHTEVQIQSAFNSLMKDRTSFIVAHRLSTIQHADRIIVMDHGRILEQGKHAQLIAKNGFYAQLYYAQFVLNFQIRRVE